MVDNDPRRCVTVKVNRRMAVVSGRESRSVSKRSNGAMITRHKEIRIERLPQSMESHNSNNMIKQVTARSGVSGMTSSVSMKGQIPTVERQKVPVQRMIVREDASMRRTTQGLAAQSIRDDKNMHSAMKNSLMKEKRLTAQEIKQKAIEKVVNQTKAYSEKKTKSSGKVHFGFKRLALAAVCAGLVVFAIVYFVNLNMPNVSLKVAAMQTGIEATYPAYVPRDYSLSDITSENGRITLNFHNNTGDMFTIIEEKSSWDSNALASNYVQKEYSDNYTIVREQGLALYISGSDAAWVNGGICFKIKTTSGYLTKKQIKNIAASL